MGWPFFTLNREVIATARSSHGPDLQRLLYGSEGYLGLIVSATVKVHPLPETQAFAAYVFADYPTGVHFLRCSRALHRRRPAPTAAPSAAPPLPPPPPLE